MIIFFFYVETSCLVLHYSSDMRKGWGKGEERCEIWLAANRNVNQPSPKRVGWNVNNDMNHNRKWKISHGVSPWVSWMQEAVGWLTVCVIQTRVECLNHLCHEPITMESFCDASSTVTETNDCASYNNTDGVTSNILSYCLITIPFIPDNPTCELQANLLYK